MFRHSLILLVLFAVILAAGCTRPATGRRLKPSPVPATAGSQAAAPTQAFQDEFSKGVPPTFAARERSSHLRYFVQTGTPAEVPNFLYPQAKCNWMGIAGQVFGPEDSPVSGLIVKVGGVLGGEAVGPVIGLTGGAPSLGQGGYELTLANAPIASPGTLWVQLEDLAEEVQSPRVYFTTYSDCDRNLILINFTETAPVLNHILFIPWLMKLNSPDPVKLPMIEK